MYYNEYRRLGIDAANKMGGTIKTYCPKCEIRKGHRPKEKNLSLMYDTGGYKCHSPNCTFQGNVKFQKERQEYSRPKWENRTNLPAKVVKYFEGRGISQKVLNEAKVSVDEKGNIQFNYFRAGKLVNVKTRFELPEGKKSFRQHTGAEKILFNLESIEPDNVKDCIIVEGEIDALSWIVAGLPENFGVVSVDQGAPNPGDKTDGKLQCITNCANELMKIERFYICTDADAPGEYLKRALIRRFGSFKCHVVELPAGKKDANEVLKDNTYQDIEVKKEALRLALKNAKAIQPQGIHSLSDETEVVMWDRYKNGLTHGSSTYFDNFDPHFKFLSGQMTLISGIPGHGKGQFIRMLAVIKAKIDGWKWAMFVPEDATEDHSVDFFEEIAHIYIGKTAHKGDYQMSEEEFSEAMEFARAHFFIINPDDNSDGKGAAIPTNDWINERIQYLRLRHGVNAYVKDPWNNISHGDDRNGRTDLYLRDALRSERSFCRQFDAAFYVEHPKQIKKDKTGAYEVPDRYDLNGGAMWINMVDIFMVVHRPMIHEMADDPNVDIHVRKVKKQKLVGRPGKFSCMYDFKKNRYYEIRNGQFTGCPLEDPTIVLKSDIDDLPEGW